MHAITSNFYQGQTTYIPQYTKVVEKNPLTNNLLALTWTELEDTLSAYSPHIDQDTWKNQRLLFDLIDLQYKYLDGHVSMISAKDLIDLTSKYIQGHSIWSNINYFVVILRKLEKEILLYNANKQIDKLCNYVDKLNLNKTDKGFAKSLIQSTSNAIMDAKEIWNNVIRLETKLLNLEKDALNLEANKCFDLLQLYVEGKTICSGSKEIDTTKDIIYDIATLHVDVHWLLDKLAKLEKNVLLREAYSYIQLLGMEDMDITVKKDFIKDCKVSFGKVAQARSTVDDIFEISDLKKQLADIESNISKK